MWLDVADISVSPDQSSVALETDLESEGHLLCFLCCSQYRHKACVRRFPDKLCCPKQHNRQFQICDWCMVELIFGCLRHRRLANTYGNLLASELISKRNKARQLEQNTDVVCAAESEQTRAAWNCPRVCQAAARVGPPGPQRGPILHRLPGHQSTAVPLPAGKAYFRHVRHSATSVSVTFLCEASIRNQSPKQHFKFYLHMFRLQFCILIDMLLQRSVFTLVCHSIRILNPQQLETFENVALSKPFLDHV